MAEPVSLQTLLTYLTLISIPVGVFYHIMTLRNTRKNQELQLETRQAQLFMQTYHKWIDKDLNLANTKVERYEWQDFDDFMRKYGPEADINAYSDFTRLAAYFEGIGVLVKRGLIDPHIVDDLMSINIIQFWEKYENLAIEFRERWNAPQVIEWVEYLYNQIKPIAEQQHPELKT
jgi:hypothetical protein